MSWDIRGMEARCSTRETGHWLAEQNSQLGGSGVALNTFGSGIP
jgi:hypothetical protein